jgi:hypothetical protein
MRIPIAVILYVSALNELNIFEASMHIGHLSYCVESNVNRYDHSPFSKH